jgi:superfamily II DNA or RNA helicase
MLQQILSNFSEDELLAFLPKDAIDFAISIGPEEGDINKTQLAGIVASAKPLNFILNDKLRAKTIKRLKSELFIELFPEFNLTPQEVRAGHYDAAVSWSSENLLQFSAKIGLQEIYETETNIDSVVESITRIEPNYSLYPYQQKISQDVLSAFATKSHSRVLVHLPTGSGKTRTAMNIAAEHLRADDKNVVLWLADREELCSQAYSEFQKAWQSLGNRPTSLYGFYSDSAESLGGIDSGFVVGGLHKFLSLRNNDTKKLKLLYKELTKSVTLVIFDEAHKAVAPKFREVVNDFILEEGFNASLLGLTATPGRSYSAEGLSEEDRELATFFNNNKFSMDIPGYLSPIDYLVEHGYLAKANFKPLTYDRSAISAYELRDSGGQETMKALASNVARNKQIINTVMRECELDSQIIVFACTVDHGINIATALAYKGIKAASIDSKNDSIESRRTKIKQYKEGQLQVLVNFNVLTAGFDAPKTNVTVIAKPMKSLVQYLQMAGRAMRGSKSGGNKECNIYTVMDDIPEFQSINIAFKYWNDMWAINKESK